MKILYLAYYFPPYNTSGSVRASKTVKYLEEMGVEVYTVSAKDQLLPKTLSVECKKENVVYTKWLNINSLIIYLLGGKSRVEQKGYAVSGTSFIKKIVKFLGSLYKSLFNFPDAQIGWYFYAKKTASEIIKKEKPDIILATSTPHTSLLIAKALSKKYNIPWVADLRDLWSDELSPKGTIRKYSERRLELATLKTASLITSVSPPLASILRTRHKKNVKVIYNGHDFESLGKNIKYNYSDKIIIRFTGILYENYQDISTFTDSCLQLKNTNKLDVDFYGRNVSLINNYFPNNSLNIKTHGFVTHDQALNLQSSCDFLLYFAWNNPKYQGMLSGKIFEYIASGVPILCIGDYQKQVNEIIQDGGFGVVIKDQNELMNFLRKKIAEKSLYKNEFINKQTFYKPNLELFHEFSRKNQTKNLYELLSSIYK